MRNIDELQSWNGRDLIDRDGDKIGSIGEVYLDDADRPAGVAHGQDRPVRDAGELRPDPRGARRRTTTVRVPYEKDQVKDAPNVDADGAPLAGRGAALYRHYGLRRERRQAALRATGPRHRDARPPDAPARGHDRRARRPTTR